MDMDIFHRIQTDLRTGNFINHMILALINAPSTQVTPARLIAKYTLTAKSQADLTAIAGVYNGLSGANQAKYLHVVTAVFTSIKNDQGQEFTLSQAKNELGI